MLGKIKITSNDILEIKIKNKLEKKILPCYMCGNNNLSLQKQWDCNGPDYWLACNRCYPYNKTELYRDINKLIKAWNKANKKGKKWK